VSEKTRFDGFDVVCCCCADNFLDSCFDSCQGACRLYLIWDADAPAGGFRIKYNTIP
jgi:hypothetical protein